MSRRVVLAVAAALTVAAAIAVGVRWVRAPAARVAPASSASALPKALALRWTPGTTRTYRLAYKARTSAAAEGLATGDLRGEVDLAADLKVRVLARRGEGWLLAAGLDRVERHELVVLGKPLLADDATVEATFRDREIFAEVDARGQIGAVYVASDAPPLFKSFMPTLIAAANVTIAGDGSREWDATEVTPVGRARSHYAIDKDGPPTVVARSRAQYESIPAVPSCAGCVQEIASTAEIAIDAEGGLKSMSADERISVVGANSRREFESTERFALAWLSTQTFDAPTAVELDTTRLERRALGEAPAPSPSATRETLEQSAAGMTAALLVSEIEGYARAGAAPSDPKWMTRAVAFLSVHPEACDKLVALFQRADAGPIARALVMDTLASTGHPQAQAAMRAALATRAARAAGGQYPALLQRFSLVQSPTTESVRFLAGAYDAAARADPLERRASAYSLGAAVGNLARSGKAAEAQEYDRKLVADLGAARKPDDKKTLLAALGNAGLADDVRTIASYAADRDASVRAEAAAALRKTDTPDARDALVGLLGDSDADVQSSAVSSLARMTLGAADFARLGAAFDAGAVSPTVYPALVNLLAAHLDAGDAVRAMLEGILARTTDLREQARIRYVLSQMPPPN